MIHVGGNDRTAGGDFLAHELIHPIELFLELRIDSEIHKATSMLLDESRERWGGIVEAALG